MSKKVLWFSISIVACLTIRFSQSQVSGSATQNNAADQKAANPHFESQTKDSLDVRDFGVDCHFTSDSSVALNAISGRASSSGLAITFPPGCHVKLSKTWVVKNLAGFSIRGTSGAGAAGYYGYRVPTISWTGPVGGTMIDMEYVDGFVVENLAIDGNGMAAVGINVDKTGAGGTINTTDGIFRRLFVHGNASGGAANADWEGIVFSNVSGQNVEDMRILDSTMYCGPSSFSGVAGIVIGASPNAKNFQFIHNEINLCAVGVWQRGGAMDLEYSELGHNNLDIRVDNWSDPNEVISHNLSESDTRGARFLDISGPAPAHPIEISGNNIPVNDTCAVNISNASVRMPVGNKWYPAFGNGAGGIKVCNTTGAGNPAYLSGSLYSLSSTDFSNIVEAQHAHNSIFGDGISSVPLFLMKSTGSLFLERGVFYGTGDVLDGLTTASGSGQAVTPCGINSWCGMEGALEVTGTDTPEGISCTVTGGDNRKIYGFYISALDSTGNETLLRGGSPYFACHGPSTLDASHNLTVNWLGSPNASGCNVYAVNTADALQVNRIATDIPCSSSGTFQVNSYPNTFPIKSPKSPYNKTLVLLYRGKEIDFQYGTPLNGFSDKGIAKTWSIDSKGAANFTGLKLGASGSSLAQMKIYSTASITPTTVRSATCSDQTFALEGVTAVDRVSNVTPPGELGNISINAYISARDTLLLHFCNPSATSVSPPRGVYSVLAVH